MQGEAAPARANVEHAKSGIEAELGSDMAFLVTLRPFEIIPLASEIGA